MSFTVRRVREEKTPSKLLQWLKNAIPIATALLRLRAHSHEVAVHDRTEKRRTRSLKKGTAILVAAFLAIVFLVATLKVIVRIKEIAIGFATVVSADVPKDASGRTNILLLGSGDNDHDGIDLTDTVMIASLDLSSPENALLLSIPRDTYLLSTEKMGADRINSLYRNYKYVLMRGGAGEQAASLASMAEVAQEVGKATGITMHGAIKINFSGFLKAVDLVDGIDVDVPADLIDPEYPKDNGSGYETLVIRKGLQHFDGALALKYVRSRHSTSDFSRAARQQQVILALADAAEKQGIVRSVGKMGDLLGIIGENMESTLSSRQLLGLALRARGISHDRIVRFQLNDQNGLFGSLIAPGGFLYAPPREEFDGAAVLLPVSIPEFPVTWKQVQAFTKLLLKDPEIFFEPTSIAVLNAGAKEGSARLLGGELTRYGFTVELIQNAKKSPKAERSFIVVRPDPSQGKMSQAQASLAHALSSLLSLPIESSPAASILEESGSAEIAIVLGSSYRSAPLQNLLTE